MVDYDELKRLAEVATPGPWFETEGHPSGRTYGIHAEAGPVVVFRGIAKPHGQGEHNAAFIAAANPATVLALLAEIAALRAACSKSNDEISQTLGKALGYPWFKDDQINFPGATAENGVCVGDHVAESLADEAARRITEAERKLAEAVGLLRDTIEEYSHIDDVRAFGEIGHAVATALIAARTFLSKEAERG